MKVVFLCQRVPYPPDRGDRITTWHLLRHLLARGDQVRVGCFQEEPRDAEGMAHLQRLGVEVCAPRLDRRLAKLLSLRGLLTGEALTLPFFRHPALRAQVERWLLQQPPELVYVYSSSMAQYAMAAGQARRFMHFAELDSDKWRQFASRSGGLGRWIYGREAKRLLAFESRVARTFDASIVVSDVEQELFAQSIPGAKAEVLPNGVDVEHFVSSGDQRREPHTLIFTGVMDYEPNVDGVLWFANDCWPAIRARFPDARLLVVGSRPSPAVLALSQKPGIEVTGRVPETPPYFDRASVAIAPLRLARGVQNKVLEAMCMQLPVVASPQAAQGLGAVPPETLVVAGDAASTIAAITDLFADPARARAMGQRAAAFVRTQFTWDSVFARFDALLARYLPASAGSSSSR